MNIFKYNNKSISINDFVSSIKTHVNEGDILYLEIDTMSFGKMHDPSIKKNIFLNNILSIFQQLAGKDGHIICPSFSYSWGNDSPEKIYNPSATRSKVGIFPEYFRKLDTVRRTNDPMFSFLIYGPRKDWFADISNNTFGKGSLFEKLHTENAKLISFGLNKYDPTFVHYVEQYFDEHIDSLEYRFLKHLQGKFQTSNGNIDGDFFTYLRSPNSTVIFDDSNLIYELKRNNHLTELQIGGGMVCISDCNSVFDAGISGLKNNKMFFTKERKN